MKRVIVDTNVFTSAFIGSKNCSEIYELLKQDIFELVISDELLFEISNVLARVNIGLNKEEIKDVIEHLRKKARKVTPLEKICICRDPKDNIVLECASVVKVDFIVTGDNDLLELKMFSNIPILTPSKFLKVIK